MSTLTRTWRDLPAVRGALSSIDLTDPQLWADRLRFDRERAERNQSRELASITAAVERRSREAGASSLVLTGSTARGRRTLVSDLDYHVIGERPELRDLREDIDVYSDDPGRLAAKLAGGDDFAHWSIWYGCVLFDDGVLAAAARDVAARDLWPDPQRKLIQAKRALAFAVQMVDSGDYDRALEDVRAALSLTARWWLLDRDVFPLARDELSDQLIGLGQRRLAEELASSIHWHPPLARLRRAGVFGQALTGL